MSATFHCNFLFLSFLVVLQPGGGGHDSVGSRKAYESSVTPPWWGWFPVLGPEFLQLSEEGGWPGLAILRSLLCLFLPRSVAWGADRYQSCRVTKPVISLLLLAIWQEARMQEAGLGSVLSPPSSQQRPQLCSFPTPAPSRLGQHSLSWALGLLGEGGSLGLPDLAGSGNPAHASVHNPCLGCFSVKPLSGCPLLPAQTSVDRAGEMLRKGG